MNRKILMLLLLCLGGGSGPLRAQTPPRQPPLYARWDFTEGIKGWKYGHQDQNPNNQCDVINGVVRIWTRAGSVDRKKICTEKKYTTGRYTWRAYVAPMGLGDQSSVGCWIYSDDHHEIDFEVGSGKAAERQKAGAQPDELLAYMTTQDHPFQSIATPIKPGWHIFEIDLSLREGNYFVQWIIDGKVGATVQQTYGDQVAFSLFCSTENLKFIGDVPASQDNYGLFDWVEYTFHP